jgi:hypothetical protein
MILSFSRVSIIKVQQPQNSTYKPPAGVKSAFSFLRQRGT